MAARDFILGQQKTQRQTPAEIYSQPIVIDRPAHPNVAKQAAQKARIVRNAEKARKRAGDSTKVEHPSFNARQEKFIELMCQVEPPTITQAAKDAGYSPKTANKIGSRLLKNVDIREEIDRRKAVVAEHCQIKAETIIGAAVVQAMSTIDDVLDEAGRFDIDRARETGAIHHVKSIAFTQTKFGENVRVEMYSSAEARRELGDYLGIKQLPRENEEKLKKIAEAVRHYIDDHPGVEPQRVFELFARGRGVTVEEIQEHLESVQ